MFSTFVDAPVDKAYLPWSGGYAARGFVPFLYRYPQSFPVLPVDNDQAFPI